LLLTYFAENYVLLAKGQLDSRKLVLLNELYREMRPCLDTWERHVENELRITPELKRQIVTMWGTEKEITEYLFARTWLDENTC